METQMSVERCHRPVRRRNLKNDNYNHAQAISKRPLLSLLIVSSGSIILIMIALLLVQETSQLKHPPHRTNRNLPPILNHLNYLNDDTQQQQQSFQQEMTASATNQAPVVGAESVLPPKHLRPDVRVNIREWSMKISDDIKLVANRTSCTHKMERFYERESEYEPLDPIKLRESILNQVNLLLSQHRAAVNAIVSEAEKLALAHNFVKDLRINYTDVHRLKNELEASNSSANSDPYPEQSNFYGGSGYREQSSSGATPQFTSIGGGTPVPGPPEWQTPYKTIMMQVDKNFGDLPVNTSMSAVHLPLQIYAGQPEIMNGIAWTEKLDNVFRRNLHQYAHVHHQYYGDHLGFLRTFPAHRWRIPRLDPDLFDARTRPWYVSGAATPKDVVILIDSSGSMTGLRREIAKGVVFEILDTLTASDYFTVMRFSESVTPIGLPKCNLRMPKLMPQIEHRCNQLESLLAKTTPPGGSINIINQQQQLSSYQDKRDWVECVNRRKQLETKGQYLRDNPSVVPGKNGSYLADEAYEQSIFNVTNDIRDAYLLPATSRNVRYLKSNFTLPTAGIANFTHALMAAFELLQAYNRTNDLGSQCNQVIMLITDGAIQSHEDVFNRYNYPGSPVRVFTYVIGREVGDVKPTERMACRSRGYYAHVINLSEVREQVQKYLPVMARPLVLSHQRPISWTNAYGDETYQVLTDWVLEMKRRERARIMLSEERERLSDSNSSDVINIELTNIPEYDELPLVDEELKNRIICEDAMDDPNMESSLQDEIDPLGYNDLSCHWVSRRADLLTSVVKPVFNLKNTSIFFERVLSKNVWTERETQLRNAQLLGVASVDLRVTDIIKAAPSHLIGPNGYAVLIGHNGFIMHHPDYRALLEDPFDKQSRILRPYYNAVDLTHIEQVYHNDTTLLNINNAAAAGASQAYFAAIAAGMPTSAAAATSVPISPQIAAMEQKRRNEDMRLFKLREAAVRRGVGVESITVKRAIDCRRRPHVRKQTYYYGPIKDTPYSFMLVLPQSYGLNRLSAKLPLDGQSRTYLTTTSYDLWTVHPDYRYCEVQTPPGNVATTFASSSSMSSHAKSQPSMVGINSEQANNNNNNNGAEQQLNNQTESVATLVKLLDLAADQSGRNNILNEIEYADLSAISNVQTSFQAPGASTTRQTYARPSSLASGERFICDKDLFPSLLFDARATFEPLSSSGSDYGSAGESCGQNSADMRSQLANIYGLELSFLATRSGLTRTRVYDLSPRIRKLAAIFIERHNKAVDEAWYSRTVDWNMRFQEEATIISVPFNAYIRLIAKLRQRITQRHPAANDTRANCDPSLDQEDDDSSSNSQAAGTNTDTNNISDTPPIATGDGNPSTSPTTTKTTSQMTSATTATLTITQNDQVQNDQADLSLLAMMANDDPQSQSMTMTPTQNTDDLGLGTLNPSAAASDAGAYATFGAIPEIVPRINYSEYSSFDFLDLLANSSVHVAATQTILTNRRTKQRTPVGVTGHLYDYATFARKFLNSTSIRIRTLDTAPSSPLEYGEQRVDICPGGVCPTQCGIRNDTIDCLLVDNNGYIIVGEELPHIGRSLVDYDEKLMASLVTRKVYHQIDLVDYQAICPRQDAAQIQLQQDLNSGSSQVRPGGGAIQQAATLLALQQSSSSSSSSSASSFVSSKLNLMSMISYDAARSLAANFISALIYITTTLYSTFLLKSANISPDDLFASESILGQLHHWQRSVIGAEAQSAIANQSLLALLPNKTYLRPCEKIVSLYETRPYLSSASSSSANTQESQSTGGTKRLYSETPEYYVTKCGCSAWYVYDAVPQTNLMVLIVNTTTACRRGCAADSANVVSPPANSGASSNLAPAATQINGLTPIIKSQILDTTGSSSVISPQTILGLNSAPQPSPTPATNAMSPNKTAEDQVCAMLERDAQLYVQRPASCLTSHPDESSIQLCGGASPGVVVGSSVCWLITTLLVSSYFGKRAAERPTTTHLK